MSKRNNADSLDYLFGGLSILLCSVVHVFPVQAFRMYLSLYIYLLIYFARIHDAPTYNMTYSAEDTSEIVNYMMNCSRMKFTLAKM